jgi:hypothetical protein
VQVQIIETKIPIGSAYSILAMVILAVFRWKILHLISFIENMAKIRLREIY